MISNLKVPFGSARMVRVTGAKYLAWEDAFEVDFELRELRGAHAAGTVS
jgi:hypothetical protein